MRMVALSANALAVLTQRYVARDGRGRPIETPAGMFRRVAENLAQADRLYDRKANVKATATAFARMMSGLEFLPNSPTLMNAGRDLQQLAACFVLGVDDSLDSIFEAVKQTALIHQSGGGTGFSFSRLRPKEDRVMSTSGIASGPVSFIRVFNTATEVIKQGGTRRGANMGILHVDHPDILEFIHVKEQPAELTNFNLSVAVTDAFMEEVKRNRPHTLINPRTGKPVRHVPARQIFDRLSEAAWKSGEPGIVFIDRINHDNPTPRIGQIEATNPCGEQPLLPYEACNLGSINLARMVAPGPTSRNTPGGVRLDERKLAATVRLAVHLLDNVIDMNRYPLPQIERMTKGNRKIGLGVMGFADLLILLGIPYDTPEARETAERVMRLVRAHAQAASAELAKARGPFPNFRGSRLERTRPGQAPLRHATTTTVAPTGTLSIIADCSSGIEPLYGVCYTRQAIEGLRLTYVHPVFARMAKAAGLSTPPLLKRIAERESIQDIAEIPKPIRRLFVTAHDIAPADHITMQAAFQRHTDNAVSKTINLPKTATPEDVRRAFLLAYREGCKGITLYRNGSRERQVLTCTLTTPYC